MVTLSHIDLSVVDDRLLDGLDFCGKVYDLFDEISRKPDGTARLRLLRSKTEQRLVGELLPLARYIQSRYREGRRIKVRWLSGSQPYDAILWSSGSLVERGGASRRVFVEVTTSVHPNEYLVRELLHQCGGSFGVKGIYREAKSRTIVSKPYVFNGGERSKDLAERILQRIKAKAKKSYPPATVLVVNCKPTSSLLLENEWKDAVEQVRNAELRIPFREVFLLDMLMSHTATLYGNVKGSQDRKVQKTFFKS